MSPQGHGRERVVPEAAAGPTVSGAVLHDDFLLGRDCRQSRDPLADPAPQRVPHALQHRGVSRLHRFDQGEREAARRSSLSLTKRHSRAALPLIFNPLRGA